MTRRAALEVESLVKRYGDHLAIDGVDTARDQRVEEVAEVLELTEFLPRLARHLSGGEKRRLHAAMALVHRPRVLLPDEPTTGVDVGTRASPRGGHCAGGRG